MENQKVDPVRQYKTKQRDFLKALRSGISFNRRKQASNDACEHLYSLLKSAHLVLSFASAGTEINLWPLNRRLAQEKRLVLPKLDQNRLELFRVMHCKDLKRHAWGILEPDSSICEPCNFSRIHSVLIPGLGFDVQTNFRLGYGLGCYDRLLSILCKVNSIGVGYREQVISFPFQEIHDIAMNKIMLF